MSVPISPAIVRALNSAHSRDGDQEFDRGVKGLDALVNLPINGVNGSVEAGDLLKMHSHRKRWCDMIRPRSASRNSSGRAAIRGWARAASFAGSLSPQAMASRMARPVKPTISEIAELS
jgi:hypothetical protein